MPYTVAVSVFDLASVLPTLPVYSGSVFMITGPAYDTATAASAGGTLTFPLTPATPLVPMAMHVTDGIGGDLFRSGLVMMPPSPSTVSLVTGVGAVAASALPAMTAALSGTSFNLTVAEWLRVIMGTLGLGFIPPSTTTITAVTLLPSAGSLSLTITATASYRWLFLIPVTATLIYSTTLNLTPSADARNPSRIIRVTPSSSTVAITDPLLSSIAGLFVGFLDTEVTTRLENVLGAAVTSAVDGSLASSGFVRTGTSVISARRIMITGTGIGLQLGISDFRFPFLPIPTSTALKITMSPAPFAGTQKTYMVHVAANGTPVANAAVTLKNFASQMSANPTITNLPPTNAQGNTTFSAVLRAFDHDATGHGGGVVHKDPSLMAAAAGFQPATLELPLESLL